MDINENSECLNHEDMLIAKEIGMDNRNDSPDSQASIINGNVSAAFIQTGSVTLSCYQCRVSCTAN